MVSFTVTGTNAKSFVSPNPVTLFFTDPDSSTYKITPIGKSLQGVGLITISQNVASMELQCDQPSLMLWVYGIVPAPSSLKFADIQRLLSKNSNNKTNNSSKGVIVGGLKAVYIDPVPGRSWLVYGSEIQTSSVPLRKRLSGLKAGANYAIRYFCKNQLGLISDPVEGAWTVPANGAYLLKMTLLFNRMLTYYQDNDIACALARQFQIPVERVFTELGTLCGQPALLLGIGAANNNSNSNIEEQQYLTSFYKYSLNDDAFEYMFYIAPDFLALRDTTNMYVREMISSKTFNESLLAKTAEPATFP